MVNIDKIKELVKEAIKTNDDELISLATDLLKQRQQNNTETEVNKKPKKQKSQTTKQTNDYVSSIKTIKQEQTNLNRMPVNTVKRFNTFVDDRTEAIGDEYKTPEIKLTERKREPPKMIEQVCTKCSKICLVKPVHKRDFYICDKCLNSMAR